MSEKSATVIPTPRGKHPGTIAMKTMFTGKTEVVPISEFPDSFIYANGNPDTPVVREEFYTYDANGQPCPPDVAVTAHIIRYGVDGTSLERVYGGFPDRANKATDLREERERWLKNVMSERKKHKP
jgi:hypothetical protein